jgi:hypothetical protein
MEKLDVPPPPPGTPGPLSRPTPEAIGGLLEGGGFSGVEVEELDVTFEFETPVEYTEFTLAMAAPIKAMLAPHPEDVQRDTRDAITEAVRQASEAKDQIKLTNQVLIAAGQA